jgi:hypothetical protein
MASNVPVETTRLNTQVPAAGRLTLSEPYRSVPLAVS